VTSPVHCVDICSSRNKQFDSFCFQVSVPQGRHQNGIAVTVHSHHVGALSDKEFNYFPWHTPVPDCMYQNGATVFVAGINVGPIGHQLLDVIQRGFVTVERPNQFLVNISRHETMPICRLGHGFPQARFGVQQPLHFITLVPRPSFRLR
jgi:hypothetical protein